MTFDHRPNIIKGMSIWNKVLIGFIFIAAVTFAYMAARTLKTHQYWRELAQAHQDKIDALEAENLSLVFDDSEKEEDGKMGIDRLRLELHKLLIDRGRVWYNCSPEDVDRQTGKVAVKTDLPDPHKIADNTILYVFDETDLQDGGQYLGEFKVTDVAQRQLAMEPAMKLTDEELNRLAASRGPWTLYEIMQIDAPRDYEILFKEYHLQHSILVDLIEAATRDKQYIESACADAQKQQQFRQAEIQQLKADVAKYCRQRDAVAGLHAVLKPRVSGMTAAVDRLIAANRAIAGRIAKAQLEATRCIDARTRRMARSDVAGK